MRRRRRRMRPFPTLWSVRSEPEGSIKGSTRIAYWRSCKRLGQKERRFAALLQSPLADSNRRPPPYHGGFALCERDGGAALVTALCLQPRRFVCLTYPSLDEPSVALTNLKPAPKTCPQISRRREADLCAEPNLVSSRWPSPADLRVPRTWHVVEPRNLERLAEVVDGARFQFGFSAATRSSRRARRSRRSPRRTRRASSA
jgi:hypothetical protein